MKQELAQRIDNRQAAVGVIGMGYVGLPLARAFWDAGFARVIGYDVDPQKVEALRAGRNYLSHQDPALVADMTNDAEPRFDATSDFGRLDEVDAILICVPTPLGEHLEPDLSYVEKTAASIGEHGRPGQLVILESTTYPGTTRDIVLPALTQHGRTLGDDVFVGYSPEREDPGRKTHTTRTIPKLVGGLDEASGELAAALYTQAFEQVVRVSSAEVAESSKLLENIYRAVNIALVNEMKVVLTEMGVDIWEVIDAAATKPFGYQPFYPGPGLGGHCIPIDPFYLTWKAREIGRSTRFIELAGQVNHFMPEYVIGRLLLALNERGKALRGAKVLVLGLAYKPDVEDVRESPSLELITHLRKLGADVDYNDPHVPRTHAMRRYDLKMSSKPLSDDMLAAYDCVLVATHHSAYDWQQVADHAKLIVDTRGAMRRVSGSKDHIVTA